jgi:ubiquinone/menaquinone biosynthesis C-methylase UbiE
VLDAGGGKGRVAALALARGAARAVTADLSLTMLAGARARHRVAAHVAALPFRLETFDVVVCALVLGHVADLGRALEALAAVLRRARTVTGTYASPAAAWPRRVVASRHAAASACSTPRVFSPCPA